MRGVALVGFMGAGKSAVGARLAPVLGLPLVDLDARIAARHGPIPELFARGEACFRRLEADELARVLAGPPCVLATGGGTPCQPGAMDRLLAWGEVVWLDVPLEVARRRVAGSDRPLAGPGMARLLAARRPCYGRARVVVDAARPLEVVVDEVLSALGRGGRP